MIFPNNHLNGTKTGFKPNQTVNELQHKELKQQLYKKRNTEQNKTKSHQLSLLYAAVTCESKIISGFVDVGLK